ncbi:hypothetical protein BDB00DRAFT_308344 [Zychaea mexicana]|uniref:uncharacterized protein n=1 Tax=Zychaea mexicana TaxID=64656 RepID=UPI0022FF154E|nr:uncharacterized protein BDB00DRAFT_308344 [Zychaea mexicana]KAI9494552.1 hypothetical protein BDB00DRAFT_308344 [Zychaea mexicana]
MSFRNPGRFSFISYSFLSAASFRFSSCTHSAVCWVDLRRRCLRDGFLFAVAVVVVVVVVGVTVVVFVLVELPSADVVVVESKGTTLLCVSTVLLLFSFITRFVI